MERRRIFPSVAALTSAVADIIARDAKSAAEQGRRYTIALSGGSTPRILHETLVRAESINLIPWDNIEFFFGDERTVPADDEQSNYRMAHETLFSRAPISKERIHRIPGEVSPATKAAKDYETVLRAHFKSPAHGFPQFDLILLGIGTDGHAASLFPATDILDETKKWVAATYVDKLSTWRISLTYPVINQARKIIVLVTGDGKSDIVHTLFNDPASAKLLPVMRIVPKGEMLWFLDNSAAARIQE